VHVGHVRGVGEPADTAAAGEGQSVERVAVQDPLADGRLEQQPQQRFGGPPGLASGVLLDPFQHGRQRQAGGQPADLLLAQGGVEVQPQAVAVGPDGVRREVGPGGQDLLHQLLDGDGALRPGGHPAAGQHRAHLELVPLGGTLAADDLLVPAAERVVEAHLIPVVPRVLADLADRHDYRPVLCATVRPAGPG
jgi:hypothetical protein